MKKTLLTLTLAILATAPVDAAAISADTWYGFSWVGTNGSAVVNGSDTFATTTPITNPGDPAWTIDSATPLYLVIVDAFLSGDQFEALNGLISLGLTSVPTSGSSGCVGGDDPLTCLADSNYTRGVFALAPGSHSITIGIVPGSFETGGAYFAVLSDDPSVPEPATYAMMGAGLVGLAFLRRSRKA